MAILLHPNTAERRYLIDLLLREAAECAQDPDLAGLHRRVLLFLCAVCEGEPFVLLDSGVTFMLYAVRREEHERGSSTESRAIIAQLLPSVEVRA